MMENGINNLIKEMVEEYKYGQMEVNMRDIGKMINLKAMVSTYILMVPSIRVSGLKISKRDMELKYGLIMQNMKGHIRMV